MRKYEIWHTVYVFMKVNKTMVFVCPVHIEIVGGRVGNVCYLANSRGQGSELIGSGCYPQKANLSHLA